MMMMMMIAKKSIIIKEMIMIIVISSFSQCNDWDQNDASDAVDGCVMENLADND